MSHNCGVEVFGCGNVSFVLWARSRGVGVARTTWLGRFHGWEIRTGRLTISWMKEVVR